MTAAETTLDAVRAMILEVMGEESDQAPPITMETSFNRDLELESIEFVALAEKMQAVYGDRVDFARWLAEKDLAEIIEMKVGDIVTYIDRRS